MSVELVSCHSPGTVHGSRRVRRAWRSKDVDGALAHARASSSGYYERSSAMPTGGVEVRGWHTEWQRVSLSIPRETQFCVARNALSWGYCYSGYGHSVRFELLVSCDGERAFGHYRAGELSIGHCQWVLHRARLQTHLNDARHWLHRDITLAHRQKQEGDGGERWNARESGRVNCTYRAEALSATCESGSTPSTTHDGCTRKGCPWSGSSAAMLQRRLRGACEQQREAWGHRRGGRAAALASSM